MVEGSRNKDKVVDIEKFWHRKRRSNPPQNEKVAAAKKAKNGGIENGGDIFGRGEKYQLVPIDDSYPDYIVENQEKYAELIKPWN